MIVAVKRKDPKRLIIKIVSIVAVVFMFYSYYNHLSDEFAQKEKETQTKQVEDLEKESKQQKTKKIERLIFKEVETAIDLIGQEFVQQVKVVNRKILIVCDSNTDLEALKVRYGTMALIKNGLKNMKIAIDLQFIIESKFEDEK